MTAKLLYILLLVVLGATALSAAPRKVPYAGKYSKKSVFIPPYKARRNELRGVWVATVENIDFPKTASAAVFKREFDKILYNAKRAGFNTIIFQVRPASDAFYFSKLNPWSRNLTGKEGTGIKNFDPLTYMVKTAHANNMQFHAWLNPYRVCGNTKLSVNKYLATLDRRNFARLNPQYVLAPPSERKGYRTLLLDPGVPEVRNHIINTVYEIISRYEVDAIHFDDYFYPYGGVGNTDFASYARHNPLKLTLDNWRRNNVDLVIKNIHEMLEKYNRKSGRRIAFGVSPFGIWGNASHINGGSLTGGKESYFINYADTRKWVQRKWIDYIVPQLYWQFSHDTAAYACLVDWWCSTVRNTGVKLYIGLAPYRIGEPSWNISEVADQMRYNSSKPEVSGNIMFSYSKIFFPRTKNARLGVNKALSLWK